MLNNHDLETLKARGIAPETFDAQMHAFATGFPFLKLAGSATVGNGIIQADDELQRAAVARWKKYLADGGDVTKFVPASGAASRMFKALFAFANGDQQKAPEGSPVHQIVTNLKALPFIDELNQSTQKLYGLDAEKLHEQGRDRDIVAAIVGADGMNYGALPKGLLTFHKYADGTVRTPVQEQLAEGAQTASGADGTVNLHFTVSANHRQLFNQHLQKAVPAMEAKTGHKFNISLSEQKPSTDTAAAEAAENVPFRDADGNLVFRPGGHGALIENLSDLDATVVFIKNIDNVVPDTHRDVTIRFKQVIAGFLVLAHDQIAANVAKLRSGKCTDADIDTMTDFASTILSIHPNPDYFELPREQRAKWLLAKFDRPLRVCGMVRNEGEPGGGPYIAFDKNGDAAPQILESTQIDKNDPASMQMMQSATHFNPVDLVCWLKNPEGQHYDLKKHVDSATGFISNKSLAGRELRALELPGLWNGAMADWSTIFVEVPPETFNPVKTVNDLLRPMHKA